MTRGRWVLLAILLVALGMGLASWPLMRLRRMNEIHKTEALIKELHAACHRYKSKHGELPKSLADLDPSRPPPVDSWGRPFIYIPYWKYSLPRQAAGFDVDAYLPEIRSRGPDEGDPADDLPRPPPGQEPVTFPSAPRSIGTSKMD